MRVVIAGGSGLIGRRLTGLLLESNHSVTVLTTGKTKRENSVRWDGKTPGSWIDQIAGADAVINLSGQTLASGRWTETRKRVLTESRLLSTKALTEALGSVSAKPATFLNASAVGFYGHVARGNVSERRNPGNDFLAHLCLQWEEEALKAESLGVRVVLLRSGVVLDPEGGALTRFLLPFKLFVGGPLGSGKQWFPWIHFMDEVRAIQFALENSNLSGPLNLTAPDPATMREFARSLGKAMRRPAFFKVPALALRILLGEMAGMVLTGQRVVPQKLLAAGFEFKFPTLEGALSDLFA